MKVLNQHNKYIIDKHIIEKIEHMLEFGYGSITINNTIASYSHEVEVDGERIVFINVGGCDDTQM